jgi:MFS family permease
VVPSTEPESAQVIRQLIEGIRHVATRRRLAVSMTLVAVIGVLGTALPVLLIGFTTAVFHSGASGYAQLTASMAFGSFVGSSLSARRTARTTRQLFLLAFAIGSLYMVASMSPTRLILTVLLSGAGAMTLFFLVAALTMLQTSTDDAMRGRVYSIYALALVAGTPICGPVVGRITEQFGARIGLFTCGLVATVAVGLVALSSRPCRATRSVS